MSASNSRVKCPEQFQPPFSVHELGGCIMDCRDTIVLEARNGGYFPGCLRLSNNERYEVHNRMLEFIVAACNAYAERGVER